MQFIKEWGLGIDGTARETLKRQSWGAGRGGAGKAERRRKFGWGKRVSRASFEETSYRAQSAR